MHFTYRKTVNDPFAESDNIVRDILLQRNIHTIDEFIKPPHPTSIHLPSLGFAKQLTDLFHILTVLKKKRGIIVVYTDYDADGITGGAILWETLFKLGFSVMPYVPHRRKEGYGFSQEGIDAVVTAYHPDLIISVDHGITGHKQIQYAQKKGIQVVVTDHHTRSKTLPSADVVFHIPELSGSGVAYMIAKEIAIHFVGKKEGTIIDLFFSDYLALATVGSIADLVPLVGPTRSLVYHGLEAFQKTKRPGIRHILKEAKIDLKQITPYEVGFMIAPRINAIGRLEHAIDALRLLCTKSEEKARSISRHMGELNRHRQDLVKQSLEQAEAIVKYKYSQQNNLPPLLILTNKDWHEGIIGLIAGKIADLYYRPTLILTKNEEVWKGSARSIEGIDIVQFLRTAQRYLESVGGHKQAAGFSVTNANLDLFTSSLVTKAEKEFTKDLFERSVLVDVRMPLSCATHNLATKLEQLQPYGVGNAQPLFSSVVSIMSIKHIGKNGNHIHCEVQDAPSKKNTLSCVFFSPDKSELEILHSKKPVEIIYSLELNKWNNNTKLQGKIKWARLKQ